MKKEGLKLVENPDYDPYIDRVPRFRNSSREEIDRLIQENPAYGEIICRCERYLRSGDYCGYQNGAYNAGWDKVLYKNNDGPLSGRVLHLQDNENYRPGDGYPHG